MRCARCDRIAIPQVLARAPDGRLVFGWCPACLEEEGCIPVEGESAELSVVSRAPISRRVRRGIRRVRRAVFRPRSSLSNRRLAVMGVAGLMAVWALILAFVGGVKLVGPNDGKGPWLLFGAGLMAMVCLGAWVAVIGRSGGIAMVRKIVQVAATVTAFGTLTWGLLRPTKVRAASVVAIAVASLVVAWTASRIGKLHRQDATSANGGGTRRRADRS